MRPVLVVDVLALARALLAARADERGAVARRLIAEAQDADLYRQGCGNSHPFLGDGTIAARCLLTSPSAEPDPDSPDHLDAMAVAARELGGWLRLAGC